MVQGQGVAWKKTAPYNLKCRKVVKLPSPRCSMSGNKIWREKFQVLVTKVPSFPQDGDNISIASMATPDDEDNHMVGDSHMDMGEKDKAVPGLQLQQLHIHGGGGPNAASNVSPADELAADEILLKFECQMYKSRDDEYMIDIQVSVVAMVHLPCQCTAPQTI